MKARALSKQLLRLNRGAYESERYEVAYHVLAAALHCADELADLELATGVQQRAESQQAGLDASVPAHPLSTHGAAARGTSPLFSSLARTAHAIASRIRGQQAQEHADAVRQRHRPGGA